MQARLLNRMINIAVMLAFLISGTGALSAQTGAGADMTDPAGQRLTVMGVSAIGEFTATGGANVTAGIFAPAALARQDYQKVYDQARALLSTGIQFRQNHLEFPPDCRTPEECRQNYQDIGNGQIFYAFCTNYNQIDARGYCPGDDPAVWLTADDQPNTSIRGKLVRARELFGFLTLAEPADALVDVGNGQFANMRELGRSGVLSTTREIANIHMIYGNEFLVDALDYRFSGNDPRADQILAEELAQLNLARQQFELAIGVLSHAFNTDLGGPFGGYVGDHFGQPEYALFGLVSERLIMSIGEIADRYRQQGRNDEALTVYANAFANQYVQAMALANSAAARNQDFLASGGWEIVNNLERLRAAAQAIHSGINPFGFVDEYVPLQTYAELRQLTQNDFLRDATEDEAQAANAQREFDQSATILDQELQNLRLTYGNRLLELCGPSSDNYQSCEGGLMEQNYNALEAAYNRINLVYRRLLNNAQQIEIEQERAEQVIQITLAGGQAQAAAEYAKGVLNAYRVTRSVVDSSTEGWHTGLDYQQQVGVGFPSLFSYSQSVTLSTGWRHAESTTSSVTRVWDPDQEKLGELTSLQTLQQAVTQAEITGANSAAAVRTLLLQQAELLIELDIAFNEYNRLASEHEALVNQYHNWLNLRAQAQANLVDSYLANPARRILRDSLTVEAGRSHGLAAQFAYLTAKALEYEFLVRYPKLDEIFKARTADDIDNFLNNLETFRVALGSPGERNRYPYRISLARDLLGLSDENLDPRGALSAAERSRLRLEEFQKVLQQNVITDTNTGAVVAVEIGFSTSLLDNRIFTPNVWNNRITGVGLPQEVPGTQGISINLLTRQFGNLGTPEVQLTHGGYATYRTATGAIVEYLPENAKPSGYLVPAGFESKTKTATILANVNGNGQGTPSSALFNRSVAASHWRLRIDLQSPFNSQLDLGQLEDIEIHMDTTGVALANRAEAARSDAQRLQAEFLKGIGD